MINLQESMIAATSCVLNEQGTLISTEKTLGDWFTGNPMPTLVPIGTATIPDLDGDEEQMATVREKASHYNNPIELIDSDGHFCGVICQDDGKWIFIQSGIAL